MSLSKELYALFMAIDPVFAQTFGKYVLWDEVKDRPKREQTIWKELSKNGLVLRASFDARVASA
jgi:hypothetical protein